MRKKREKFHAELRSYPSPKNVDPKNVELWREYGRPRYHGRPEFEPEEEPSIFKLPWLVGLGAFAVAVGLFSLAVKL